MDEDWDDGAPAADNGISNVVDSGRAFSRGRGFTLKTDYSPPGNDGWGDNGDVGNGGGYNNDSEDNFRGSRRGTGGRGGGRGGRGSRGGRGGRGGFQNSYGDNNNDDFESGNRDGGRGRGGRGRGGGGRGGRNDDNDENGEQEEKKREIYIPPEMDEEELYLSGNTSGINFIKYENISVKTNGENVPPPMKTFSESNLRPLVLENIQKSGYTTPTPIQKHSIPIIMNTRDLMACAQTGSGKTAAFLLPIIHRLLADNLDLVAENHVEPQAVIVSPTRELCIQIFNEAKKFAHGSILKVCILYGGTSVMHQKNSVMRGCHILVATPGRLNDFVSRGHITFASIRFMVLDEADRMLDMGFLPCVEEIMNHDTMTATGDRTTLMFSATFPEEIQHLAGKFLYDYIFVAVGIVGGACADVEQRFYEVGKFKKRQKLLELLQEEGSERTLVFVETKRNVDFIAIFLCENDVSSTSIHGDRLQRERETALREFKQGVRNVLVATDVAARGLDIKNVKHVINFDLPKHIEEYVHRIGRTGRLGNRGKASSFFDSSADLSLAKDLLKVLKEAEQPVPDWLDQYNYGQSMYETATFGGEDVRGDTFRDNQQFTAKPVEERDEEW